MLYYNDVRVKRYFAPNLISTNCSAAKQLLQFSYHIIFNYIKIGGFFL